MRMVPRSHPNYTPSRSQNIELAMPKHSGPDDRVSVGGILSVVHP